MSKHSMMTTAFVDYAGGSTIPEILQSMWELHCEGASDVQATVNGVRVIMIDEKLFKALGGVKYK